MSRQTNLLMSHDTSYDLRIIIKNLSIYQQFSLKNKKLGDAIIKELLWDLWGPWI
jgi:hypothetical protein